jgi:hypothetical protein
VGKWRNADVDGAISISATRDNHQLSRSKEQGETPSPRHAPAHRRSEKQLFDWLSLQLAVLEAFCEVFDCSIFEDAEERQEIDGSKC